MAYKRRKHEDIVFKTEKDLTVKLVDEEKEFRAYKLSYGNWIPMMLGSLSDKNLKAYILKNF